MMMMMEDLPHAEDLPPVDDHITEISPVETDDLVPVLIESKWRIILFAASAFLAGILVAVGVALVIAYLIGRSGSKKHDHGGWAPPPGPREYIVAAPLFSPLSSLAVAELARRRDLTPNEKICNKTINRDDCLAIFDGTQEAGDLKQWTVKAMEAAQQAVNESYVLTQSMKKANQDNLALQQCIDALADALGNVNRSIFLVNTTDMMSSGAADVQTLMSAAMTNCETCGEGVEDIDLFPGSERVAGRQAKHVDTMLSIALTFVNYLSTTPTVDLYQNRRLLYVKAGSGSSLSGIIPAKIRRIFPR